MSHTSYILTQRLTGETTMTNYISTTDTAKMLRGALKEAFPGVKFAVRSDKYSMGSSINVSWTDGPNEAMVESVAKVFAGSYFDGQIDYKGSRYVMIDGIQSQFGANYVFCRRNVSAELETKITAAWARKNYDASESNDYWFRQFRAKFNVYLAPKASKTVARIIYMGNDGYSQTGALQVHD